MFYPKKNVIAKDDTLLERIARHLMMHASFLPNIGLYHGKMGIVLFFAHYARYTGNPLYEEYAGELMNEVYEGYHPNLPANFEYGLCGIGWGIEYLLQNGFMEGDADEILAEIDAHVMERDLRRITDLDDKAVFDIIINTLPQGEDITSWNLGLEKGCAGVGLKMMGI